MRKIFEKPLEKREKILVLGYWDYDETHLESPSDGQILVFKQFLRITEFELQIYSDLCG